MENHSEFTHVKFVYFKESGKYYSEGALDFPYAPFYDICTKVREMLKRGERPGLIDGHDFDVLCTVYTDVGPLPVLFVKERI